MKTKLNPSTTIIKLASFFLLLTPMWGGAATPIWTGGGGSTATNWSTKTNWSSNAKPGNTDALVFGASVNQTNIDDDTAISGGTNAHATTLTFTNGGFYILGSNTVSLAINNNITNQVGTNTLSVPLILQASAGTTWNIWAGTELRVIGGSSQLVNIGNSPFINTGAGKVRWGGASIWNAGFNIQNGAGIIDGNYNSGSLTITNDGGQWNANNSWAGLQITNGGSLYLVAGSGNNLNLGNTANQAGTNELDISDTGTIAFGSGFGNLVVGAKTGTTNVVNQAGGTIVFTNTSSSVVLANASQTLGNYYLSGGTLITSQITNGAGTGNFYFNGGALRPTATTTAFLTNLTAAYVTNGGAIIYTANLNIGFSQPLLNLGSGGLTKVGSGTLTLFGTNTYVGNTVISNGTLALSGGALITNSAAIVVASNAIFSVSGLSSVFTLAQSLSSQTLSNSAPGAIINGTNNASSGTLSLVYDGVNPSFTITNGGINLSSSTTFKINNTGSALRPGSYLIISNITTGTAGLVAGTPPTVTLGGNGGPNAGTTNLSITTAGLWLNVGGTSSVSYGSTTTFTYDGTAHTPGITSISGSTGLRTTNYVGTGSTSYLSVNAPTNAGSYYVSNTVAADVNYFGTNTSQAFTINPAATSWNYTGTGPFTYKGSAQTPTISYTGSTGTKWTNYVGVSTSYGPSANAPTNAGNYYVTNTVLSDVNYIGTTNSQTFTIIATNLTITAQPNTKVYDGTTSATNPPTITAGGTQGSDVATLTEAYATATVGTGKTLIPSIAITNAGLNVLANYNVTLVTNFTGVINSAQSTTSTSLLLTNSIGGTNDYGQTLVFTAVVQTNGVTAANATTNIIFSLGNTPVWTNALVNGTAYYTNSSLTVGVTNFTAQYLGDTNYVGSSLTVTQTVLQTTPTLTVISSNIIYGATLVDSLLTGSVATNGNNQAGVTGSFTFTTPGIAPNSGSTNVSVTFTPEDTTNYATATTNIIVNVSQAVSTATLAVNNTPATYNGSGQAATVSIAASNTAGTVTSILTGGQSLQTNTGTYTVTANFVPNNTNYTTLTGLTATNSFTINQAVATYTAGVSLVSSSPTNGYLSSVNFTAVVPTYVNSGSVVFLTTNEAFSTNTITGGIATSVTITNLPRGTNVITAQYAGDANVAGWTNSILQVTTNHPPVAAVMTVVGTQGVDLAIALSDVATNWTDADGDPISLTGVTLTTTNGIGLYSSNWVYQTNGSLVSIVTTNSWSFIFYPGGPSVADQISYSINDGQGGTNIGYINIVLDTNPVVGTNSIASYDFTHGVPFRLTAYGVIGQTYITQRSTNLTDWANIATNVVNTNGVINVADYFIDLGSNAPSPLFYRLKWQSP